jgi:competence protein ComEC
VGRVKHVVAHTPVSQSFLSRARFNLTQHLRSALPGQRGEIAAALVTGDRSGISQPLRNAFANAGIAHILAISGLHVSLVAGMLFFTIRRLLSVVRVPLPLKKVAALLVIPATFSYVAIAGFGFPAIRAFIMVSLVMLAIIVDRQPLSMRSVALAATVVLGLFPSALLSVSFQLSFAAVISLIAFYEKRWVSVGDWLPQSRLMRLAVYTLSIILTTLIATLATTPFTLATFNRFTLQAVLGNMVAIPLTGVWIMPLAIASVLCLAWGGFAFLFTLWGLGIEGLIQTAVWVSALPGAAINVATPHPLYLLTFVAGGLWLCLWRRTWRFGGVAVMLGAHLWLWVHHLPHIYIAPDASVAALRDGATLLVSHPYKGRFWVNQWLKENGLTELAPWPEAVATLGPVVIQSNPWADISDFHALCHACSHEFHLYDVPPLCPQSQLMGPEDIRTHQGVFIHLPPPGHALQIIKPARRPWN